MSCSPIHPEKIVVIDEPITIDPYSAEWPGRFASECAVLCRQLPIDPSRVRHIGSTSVVGLHAKPIVDIMLGWDRFPVPPHVQSAIVSSGYEACGEAGVPGRLYYRKRAGVTFNVQLVVFGG